MAATLSSLWSRAQNNKRPGPSGTSGSVDLTVEDSDEAQVSRQADNPASHKRSTADQSDRSAEEQPALDPVRETKRRRLEQRQDSKVCTLLSCPILKL